ncbi:MAG TPA: discoidin domain-containing protein, partial [Polyangiaceae bacterium]
MTTGEPQSAQDEKPAQTRREGALLARIRDWFWRGPELDKVRAALPEPGARSQLFAQRAQATAELAHNMLEPVEPGEISAVGSACESYRQASYWALCALLAKAEPSLSADDSERIWSTLDEASLLQAASSADRVAGLRSALSSGSFVFFAELPASEQTLLLAELKKLTQALLVKLAERATALDRVYLQRAWRMAFLGLCALCVAMTPALVRKVIEARSDLSSGKPWRASSKLEGGGCTSPAQQCAENNGFFFHTNEEANPWIEFDLGTAQKVSKVVVENRSDCCADRANPLVIEVSTDQKHWHKVARHDGEFTSWQAQFTPTQSRYVRLRLLK